MIFKLEWRVTPELYNRASTKEFASQIPYASYREAFDIVDVPSPQAMRTCKPGELDLYTKRERAEKVSRVREQLIKQFLSEVERTLRDTLAANDTVDGYPK